MTYAYYADVDADGISDEWELATYGDLDDAILSDGDSDGRADLLEYAFGTDPGQAQMAGAGQEVSVVSDGAYDYFTYAYVRSKEAALGLAYRVEVSHDLSDWDASGHEIEQTGIVPIDDDRELVIYQSRTSKTEVPRLFWRLKVSTDE